MDPTSLVHVWQGQANLLQLPAGNVSEQGPHPARVTQAWGENEVFTSKGQLINTWLTQANMLCSKSCENLQLIRNRSQAECTFSKLQLTITEVGGLGALWGGVVASYKSLIQIRWVQTLLWKLLLLGTTTVQTCGANVTLPWKTSARPPTKPIENAEKQSILIPTPLLNPREFLLGENNTDNSTLGRHVRSSLWGHGLHSPQHICFFLCAPITLYKPGR